MPLPSLCPKSKNSACSGDACAMYTTDWRSKDEYCMIGYYPAGSRKKLGEPVEDTYARGMKGINEGKITHTTRKTERILQEDELPETSVLDSQAESQAEDVTNLISQEKIEKKQVSKDFINLKDIPDDYEEEFWS
jgi:hypothetical protein